MASWIKCAYALAAALVLQASVPAAASLGESGAAPNRAEAVRLIRSTLDAINDANVTANYSVLHGLGSPEFQSAYPVATLAQQLGGMRDRHLDLGIAVSLEPIITNAAFNVSGNIVQLVGYFPTAPARLTFRLSYKYVDSRWALHGFDLGLDKAPEAPHADRGA
ncbi:MAG: hypothetical protein AB7S70_06770 [Hyphomicrobium sp.]